MKCSCIRWLFFLMVWLAYLSLPAQVRIQGDMVNQGRSLVKLAKRMTFFAGLSSVSLRGNPDFDNGRQFRTGYAFGAGIQQPIIENLQLSLKLLYERKGDQHTYDVGFYNEELQIYEYHPVRWETTIDYLIAPVMLEFAFGHKTKYHFGGGGFAGYLIRHRLKRTELFSGYTQSNNIIENFERFDFGASFIIGVKMPLGKSFVSIQVEDHLGLVNIGDYAMDGVLKTNSLILLIGFTLQKNNHKA